MFLIRESAQTIAALTLALLQASAADGAKQGPWDTDALFAVPAYREATKAKKDGFKALLYSALPYCGKPVEVFAYYRAPDGSPPDSGWPAVVCVHGGGGTAFDGWVTKWNEHGYAAISMDLEGHYPIAKEGETNGDKGGAKKRRAPRMTVEKHGPSRQGVFHDFAEPLEEQWYFHAVAQVVLAHSLIRSFPEVDANRTGVTGISWGGTLTSTTMGIDDRFKFAVPVYGCGFLPGSDGHQGRSIKDGKHRQTVQTNWDGSAYFGNVRIPTLWVNGTNDHHFSMPATQASSQAVRGASTLRFQKGMGHGHGPGWAPEEIYVFADSVVRGGVPLPELAKPKLAAGEATCAYTSTERIRKAELLYTTDTCVWPDRKWQSTPAQVAEKLLSADVPEHTTAVFFSVTDTRDLTVTSRLEETKND